MSKHMHVHYRYGLGGEHHEPGTYRTNPVTGVKTFSPQSTMGRNLGHNRPYAGDYSHGEDVCEDCGAAVTTRWSSTEANILEIYPCPCSRKGTG